MPNDKFKFNKIITYFFSLAIFITILFSNSYVFAKSNINQSNKTIADSMSNSNKEYTLPLIIMLIILFMIFLIIIEIRIKRAIKKLEIEKQRKEELKRIQENKIKHKLSKINFNNYIIASDDSDSDESNKL